MGHPRFLTFSPLKATRRLLFVSVPFSPGHSHDPVVSRWGSHRGLGAWSSACPPRGWVSSFGLPKFL